MTKLQGQPLTDLAADDIVNLFGDIFAHYGDQEYLGEQVTMAQHMLQAASLAVDLAYSEPLIVAALLHDIGHFTSELGTFSMKDTEDRYHQDAGADFLASFLPGDIVEMVRHHVAAKRYLCATDETYFDRLSDASKHSLSLQGGPMSESEVSDFNNLVQLSDIIKLRILDDEGKLANKVTPDFSYFAPMIQRQIERRRQLDRQHANQAS